MKQSDELIRRVLSDARVIACVGASPNPARPSHYVSQFLVARGYRVIPVNPGQAGNRLFGETVVATLDEIDMPVDMIDVFRRSDQVVPVVEAALKHFRDLRTVWMQLGVESAEATALAETRGVTVIQNRCPKIEIPRLFPHTFSVG